MEGIKKSRISDSRQSWIDDLRTSISQYVSEIHILAENNDEKGNWKEARRLLTKIALLSKPGENNFDELLREINQLHEKVGASYSQMRAINIQQDIEKIIAVSQSIFNSEWQKIKQQV